MGAPNDCGCDLKGIKIHFSFQLFHGNVSREEDIQATDLHLSLRDSKYLPY